MILVIDDLAIFREPIAACLRLAGYQTLCAVDGRDGLAKTLAHHPDLILLDVLMPVMDGPTFLQHLRKNPAIAGTAVIMLSAMSEKEHVVQAIRLGARGYLLKSQFSTKELLERVKKNLPATAQAAAVAKSATRETRATPSMTSPEAVRATEVVSLGSPAVIPAGAALLPASIPKRMDRDQCLRRVDEAVQAKTLSGVVAQVMALAASPRGDMKELASFIARDPMLSARVLATANSAAYSTKQGMIATIPEAVKRIGFNSVRNIAVAVGIFDAMPKSGTDGFNPIRCWQHSFAVAQLCEQIEQAQSEETAPLAYVVGLCHELGELLIRAEFPQECQRLLELQSQTGRPIEELEREMLGITCRQLKLAFIKSLGLPESIRRPIEAYHRGGKIDPKEEHLADVLRLANSYANGLLLATGPGDTLAPLTRLDCRAITGIEDPERPEADQFRANICALTTMLAKLGPAEESRLMAPLFPQQDVRVWLVRDTTLSKFDPIFAAMDCLAKVQLRDRLPQDSESSQYDALLVLAQKPSARGLSGDDIRKATTSREGNPPPILWLTGSIEGVTPSPTPSAAPVPRLWPVTLSDLATFVAEAKKHGSSQSAAA